MSLANPGGNADSVEDPLAHDHVEVNGQESDILLHIQGQVADGYVTVGIDRKLYSGCAI